MAFGGRTLLACRSLISEYFSQSQGESQNWLKSPSCHWQEGQWHPKPWYRGRVKNSLNRFDVQASSAAFVAADVVDHVADRSDLVNTAQPQLGVSAVAADQSDRANV